MALETGDSKDIVTRINTAITTDYNATLQQRDLAGESLRFGTVPGAQYDNLFPDFFSDDGNRPKMEFNKVSQAVHKALGEWVNNRFRPKFRPEGDSSEANAKILNGLYRKDERRSGTEYSDNAVTEMLYAGIGHFRIGTEFLDEENPEKNEQRTTFDPIYSSFNMVFWDSNAKRYDKRDATRCTLLHRFTTEGYKEKYPGHAVSSVPSPNDRSVFNWNSTQNVFVAEYYEVIKKKELVFVFENEDGEVRNLWARDIKDVIDELATMGFKKTKERKKTRRYIEKTVISGSEVLEKTERIPGKMIPIIPLYGFRSVADGQEFYHGLVENMKDAQKLFNMSISKLAETAATSGKRIPIFYPDEVEGLDLFWAEHALGNKPYLLKRPHLDAQKNEIPHPMEYIDPPPPDPANIEVAQLASDFIQQERGGNPQDVLDPTASGKAINAVIERVDMQTAILFDNIKKSMKWAGEVWRWIAADIYDSQRFITLLEQDDTESQEQLFKWVVDEETGMPIEINDITTGEFETVVDTGPSFANKRKEIVEKILELLAITPPESEEFTLLYSIIIDNLEGEGLEDFKKFNRKKQISKGFKEPESDEEKAMVQQQQEQANEKNEQQELLQAAAQEAMANAKESESKVSVNLSTARNKDADTQKILSEIEGDRVALLQSHRKQDHTELMDRVNAVTQDSQFSKRALLDGAKIQGEQQRQSARLQ